MSHNPNTAVIVGLSSDRNERPLLELSHWINDGSEGLHVTSYFGVPSPLSVMSGENALGDYVESGGEIIRFEIAEDGKITYTLSQGKNEPYEKGSIVHGEKYLHDAMDGKFFRSIVGE